MLIKKTKKMTDSERIAVDNSNNQWLQALSYTAVGTIYPYAGTVAPDSFMICDGSALDKNEYPELFAVIGYSFGGSDDKFNIPDLRGRTLVGLKSDDKDFDSVGKSAGEKAHNLDVDEIPSHTHGHQVPNLIQSYAAGNETIEFGFLSNGSWNTETGTSTGGSAPHNNMPPYTVCNYIIKVVNKLSNELNIIVNVKADEEYNPESENAQSGKAVAEAVNNRIPKMTVQGRTVDFKKAIALKEPFAGELHGKDDEDYTTVDIAPYDTAELPYLNDVIATYGNGGRLNVNTPIKDFDCANKAYVDEAVNDRIPKPTHSSAPFLSVVTVNRSIIDGNEVLKDTAFGANFIDDPYVEGKSIVHGGYLVQRDGRGNLWTGEPVDDEDCVPYSMYKALLERVKALEART